MEEQQASQSVSIAYDEFTEEHRQRIDHSHPVIDYTEEGTGRHMII
jgi:hypothetical protein